MRAVLYLVTWRLSTLLIRAGCSGKFSPRGDVRSALSQSDEIRAIAPINAQKLLKKSFDITNVILLFEPEVSHRFFKHIC
jgi:hypothetical protein